MNNKIHLFTNKVYFVLCLALILVKTTMADSHRASITSSVNKVYPMIGDRITFTSEVIHPKGTKVQWPDIDNLFRGFEVLQKRVSSDIGSKILKQKLTVTLIIFTPGAYLIKSLPVKIISPSDTFLLKSKQITISCKNLPVDINLPFKDIHPSEEIKYTKSEILPYKIGLRIIIIVSFFFLLVYAMKKYPSIRIIGSAPHFYRQAITRIKKMKNEGDIQSQLHDVLRIYIGNRFSISAKTASTKELLGQLKAENLEAKVLHNIETVLEILDKANFSQEGNKAVEKDILLDKAKEFILATKPSN